MKRELGRRRLDTRLTNGKAIGVPGHDELDASMVVRACASALNSIRMIDSKKFYGEWKINSMKKLGNRTLFNAICEFWDETEGHFTGEGLCVVLSADTDMNTEQEISPLPGKSSTKRSKNLENDVISSAESISALKISPCGRNDRRS